MSRKEITEGDLLFHAVHGVCRVDEVDRDNPSGRKTLSYSLVPNHVNRMKVRFVIQAPDLGISGFHTLISAGEAQEILDYLKTGKSDAGPEKGEAWVLAKSILDFSREAPGMKDARKRQALDRSAKGLVGELAFVLNMTLKDTAASIKKSLGNPSYANPSLVAALASASEG